MNEEEKNLLEETHQLAKENNKILHGIRSSNRWSMFFRLFYWLLIIGVSIGAFVYIQPYIDSLMEAYSGVKKITDTIIK